MGPALPCSLSKRLREIPAAQSESNALYGLDSTHLAQLALRDAAKAVSLDAKKPSAHLQQAKTSSFSLPAAAASRPLTADLCRARHMCCWSSTAQRRAPSWRAWLQSLARLSCSRPCDSCPLSWPAVALDTPPSRLAAQGLPMALRVRAKCQPVILRPPDMP